MDRACHLVASWTAPQEGCLVSAGPILVIERQ